MNGAVRGTFDGTGGTLQTALDEYEQSIFLQTGDVFRVEGVRNQNELARLDAFLLTPLDPGINTAPFAVNDFDQMLNTEVKTFTVLANDTDADDDPLTVVGIRNGTTNVLLNAGESFALADGTVTLNANSTLTFDPNGGFEGTVFVEYILSDGTNTDIGELTIDVFDNQVIPPLDPVVLNSALGERSADLRILANTIENRNLTIDWGDASANDTATVPSGSNQDFSHTFATGGDFLVTITSNSTVANQTETFRVLLAADVAQTVPRGGETLTGDNGINAILGDFGNDVLSGLDGDDLIRGEAGRDIITGGFGADTLFGGAGVDEFVYREVSEGADLILDFTPGEDKIRVDAAGFGGDLFAGMNVELLVAVGAATLNEDGAFLYNPVSGALFYDRSGAGFSQPVLLATLDGAPAITANDIIVSDAAVLERTRDEPVLDERSEPAANAPSVPPPADDDERPAPVDEAPPREDQSSGPQQMELQAPPAGDPAPTLSAFDFSFFTNTVLSPKLDDVFGGEMIMPAAPARAEVFIDLADITVAETVETDGDLLGG